MTENLRGYIIPDSWMYFNDTKPMSYNILEDIFYFCMIYPALIVFASIFSKSNLIILSGLYLIIPILLMTIIRRKAKHFVTFFALHLLIYLSNFFIFFITSAPIYLIIIYTIFLIGTSIFSIRLRYDSEKKVLTLSHFIIGEILILFLYIVAALNGYIFAKSLITPIEIFFALIFLIYFQFVRTDKLLQWEEQSTLLIDKKIHNVKKYFTAGICIILGMVTWLVLGTGIAKYLDLIEYYVLSKLYSLLHPNPNANIVSKIQVAPPTKAMEKPAILNAISGKPTAPSEFSIYFFRFIEIVIFLIIIILLIKLLLNIGKSIYQGFYRNSYTEKVERESVFSIDDTSKKFFESINTLKNKFKIPFDTSSRIKIRKLYEKMLIKYKNHKVKILNSYTPSEIEKSIINENYYYDIEITKLYEKARYSNEDITKEDFEMMKKFISDLYSGRSCRKVDKVI